MLYVCERQSAKLFKIEGILKHFTHKINRNDNFALLVSGG